MTGVEKRAKNRMVAVNDRGLRIGESHPRAVLTDHEVDLLLELRAEVDAKGAPKYSLSWLAAKFEIHKGTAAKIVSGQRRGQVTDRFKTLLEPESNRGVSAAAKRYKLTHTAAATGVTRCQSPLHRGDLVPTPVKDLVLLKRGLYVCVLCAERLGRRLAGKAQGEKQASRGVTSKSYDRSKYKANKQSYKSGKAGDYFSKS